MHDFAKEVAEKEIHISDTMSGNMDKKKFRYSLHVGNLQITLLPSLVRAYKGTRMSQYSLETLLDKWMC